MKSFVFGIFLVIMVSSSVELSARPKKKKKNKSAKLRELFNKEKYPAILSSYRKLIRTPYLISREGGVPMSWIEFESDKELKSFQAVNSKISISALRHKGFNKSLLWQWRGNGAPELKIVNDPYLLKTSEVDFYRNGLKKYTSANEQNTVFRSLTAGKLVSESKLLGAKFWIYNETPSDDSTLLFTVGNKEKFILRLNYRGWRLIEIKGRGDVTLKVQGEMAEKAGHLFIDSIRNSYMNLASGPSLGYSIHTPARKSKRLPPETLVMSDKEINTAKLPPVNAAELKKLDDQVNKYIVPGCLGKFYPRKMRRYDINKSLLEQKSKIAADYNKVNIADFGNGFIVKKDANNIITGPAGSGNWDTNQDIFRSWQSLFEPGNKYLQAVLKGKIKDSPTVAFGKLVLLFKHIQDQGFTDGASLAGQPLSYLFFRKGQAECFFALAGPLMKYEPELFKDLQSVFMRVYMANSEIRSAIASGKLIDPKHDISLSIDKIAKDKLHRLLMYSLLPADTQQKALFRYYVLQYYKRALENACRLGDKNRRRPITPGFVTSGHGNDYFFAYGSVSIDGIMKLIEQMGKGEPAKVFDFDQQLLGNLISARELYPLIAYHGVFPMTHNRHGTVFFTDRHIQLTRDAVKKLSFTNDKRLKKMRRWLKGDKQAASEYNNGNRNYNYAILSTQQRDHFAATVRGGGPYIRSTEILDPFAHGRMAGQTMGHLQLFKPDGVYGYSSYMDHSKMPGSTTIGYPAEYDLKSALLPYFRHPTPKDIPLLNGGLSHFNVNGLFHMRHHDPRMTFAKSWFFFDDLVLCVGSNIKAKEKKYPVQTILFQQFHNAKPYPVRKLEDITQKTAPALWNDFPVKIAAEKNSHSIKAKGVTRQQLKAKSWIYDLFGNGYVFLSQVNFVLKRDWIKNSLAVDTKTDPSFFSTAWIDHGKNAKSGSYSYIVVPNNSEKYVAKIAAKPPVEVLKLEWKMHIARDNRTGTTGYIFEDGQADVNVGYLLKKKGHGFAMITPVGKDLKLSVCDPDLNPKPLDPKAAWSPKKITLTIKGSWKLKEANNNCKIIKVNGNQTIIEFSCIDGIGVDALLTKK